MPEPLTCVGATAAVIGIAQLTEKLWTKLIQLVKAWKDLPAKLESLRTQLPLLGEILAQAKLCIESRQVTHRNSGSGLDAAIDSCRRELEELHKLLDTVLPSADDNKLQLKWKKSQCVRKGSEIAKAEERIGIIMERITFYCAWSSSELNPNNNRHFADLTDWLIPADASVNLAKAAKQATDGTGLWFLRDAAYQEWRSIPSSWLWLHGLPGTGKTILSSTIINNLIKALDDDADPACALAYFFFDFNDREKQTPEALLKSLVSQLLHSAIPKEAQEIFQRCKHGLEQPSESQMLLLLNKIVEAIPTVYVVVDALDECTSRKELLSCINSMFNWKSPHLHVILTSRRETDIQKSLAVVVPAHHTLGLESHKVDADIQRYTIQRLESDSELSAWNHDPEIRQEIIDTISKKAKGMFRWAACQLDALALCMTRNMARRTLAELPEDLDETYVRILANINKRYTKYAVLILRWLAFSERPLEVDEILEATGIQVGQVPGFDKDEALMQVSHLQTICSSLITIYFARPKQRFKPVRGDLDAMDSSQSSNGSDGSNNADSSLADGSRLLMYVRLAHFSVKEFLVSDRIASGPISGYALNYFDSNDLIAQECLTYLLRFQERYMIDDQFVKNFPLAVYAARYWTRHVKNNEAAGNCPSQNTALLMDQLLISKSPAYDMRARLLRAGTKRANIHLWVNENEELDPLFAMCHEGVLSGVQSSLRRSTENINVFWDGYGSPLITAIQGKARSLSIIGALIDAGADVDCGYDRDGTEDTKGANSSALAAACVLEDIEVIDFLLARGANVNGPSTYGPLAAVAARGQLNIVQHLLSKDASPDGLNDSLEVPLVAALQAEDSPGLEVFYHPLNNGADVNKRSYLEGNVLLIAMDRDDWDLVRELVTDYNADINAVVGPTNAFGMFGMESEKIILQDRDVEEIEFLIGLGARDQENKALRDACSRRRQDIVSSLLRHCPDINLRVTDAGTPDAKRSPLGTAITSGYPPITELLLSAGATDTDGAILQWLTSALNEVKSGSRPAQPSMVTFWRQMKERLEAASGTS